MNFKKLFHGKILITNNQIYNEMVKLKWKYQEQ